MIGGVLLVGALGLVPQALPLHRPFHTPASPILLRQPESTEPVAPEPRAESPREAAASNAVTEAATDFATSRLNPESDC